MSAPPKTTFPAAEFYGVLRLPEPGRWARLRWALLLNALRVPLLSALLLRALRRS